MFSCNKLPNLSTDWKEQCVPVLPTTVALNRVSRGVCRTKPYLCLLTSALLDNTFLVGRRGNIQMGSPQLFFHYLSKKIPGLKTRCVCACAGGWGSCFKQTLSSQVIMPCHGDVLCSWRATPQHTFFIGLFSAEDVSLFTTHRVS